MDGYSSPPDAHPQAPSSVLVLVNKPRSAVGLLGTVIDSVASLRWVTPNQFPHWANFQSERMGHRFPSSTGLWGDILGKNEDRAIELLMWDSRHSTRMSVGPSNGWSRGQSSWVTAAVMKPRVSWVDIRTASTMCHGAGGVRTRDKQALCWKPSASTFPPACG